MAQTNGERRYPLVYHKIGEKKWQRDSRGEEDTLTDMMGKDNYRGLPIRGPKTSPAPTMFILCSHKTTTPIIHHRRQLRYRGGLRLENMQAVFADVANTDK